MLLRRVAVATTAAVLILAAIVVTGMALRGPVSRAFASVRDLVRPRRRQPAPLERRV
jgi:hypothetical protein